MRKSRQFRRIRSNVFHFPSNDFRFGSKETEFGSNDFQFPSNEIQFRSNGFRFGSKEIRTGSNAFRIPSNESQFRSNVFRFRSIQTQTGSNESGTASNVFRLRPDEFGIESNVFVSGCARLLFHTTKQSFPGQCALPNPQFRNESKRLVNVFASVLITFMAQENEPTKAQRRAAEIARQISERLSRNPTLKKSEWMNVNLYLDAIGKTSVMIEVSAQGQISQETFERMNNATVRYFAILQSAIRDVIRVVVNFDERRGKPLPEIEERITLDIVRHFKHQTFSIGDFVSHILPVSSFEQISASIKKVSGIGLEEIIRNELERAPNKLFGNTIGESLAFFTNVLHNLITRRNVICHELALDFKPAIDDSSGQWLVVTTLLIALSHFSIEYVTGKRIGELMTRNN